MTVSIRNRVPCDLECCEASVYSQNGEDGVLREIFRRIGATNRYFVEFGVGPEGRERNTRLLEQRYGWTGLLMDCCAPVGHPRVRREMITAENIDDLFVKHEVPEDFDLLSIDIDGNDYWVWKALHTRYRPRVLLMEYNSAIAGDESKTIAYDPGFRWSGTDYFGASLLALERLSRTKGYTLVYCEVRGINAFFIRSDVCPYVERPFEEIWRPADYTRGKYLGLARFFWPRGVGHRPDQQRRMIDV